MNPIYHSVINHLRCPESLLPMGTAKTFPAASSPCGDNRRTHTGSLDGQAWRAVSTADLLAKILGQAARENQGPDLALDLARAIESLHLELYPMAAEAKARLSRRQPIRSLYYALRPLLPVAVRKWAQKAYLAGWQRLPFPHWPVDFTADDLLERLLLIGMKMQQIESLPFIWFWPNGKKSGVVITHDVETEAGRDFTSALMDLDDAYGVRSSFQVIPEDRYALSAEYLAAIRERGFEVNVHDLTHDGSLFRDRERFLRQARQINQFGSQWKALGFRSGALYRRQEWFHALQFEYDMSVPNVASLEPQRGGCCTVFPYFIGDILEIPVTAAQDYSLFHILNDYSLAVWQKQIELICQRNGLISFIVHPDYIQAAHPRRTYESLLQHINQLRQTEELWVASPGELNRWWRMRQQSRLLKNGASWTIEGPAKGYGRIAYAWLADDHIVYEITSPEAQRDTERAVSITTEVA